MKVLALKRGNWIAIRHQHRCHMNVGDKWLAIDVDHVVPCQND